MATAYQVALEIICDLSEVSRMHDGDAIREGGRSYAPDVERTLIQRIHNPRNFECGCEPGCWCRRTMIGRAVKWWFPARFLGLRHKNHVFDGMTDDQVRDWKRARSLR